MVADYEKKMQNKGVHDLIAHIPNKRNNKNTRKQKSSINMFMIPRTWRVAVYSVFIVKQTTLILLLQSNTNTKWYMLHVTIKYVNKATICISPANCIVFFTICRNEAELVNVVRANLTIWHKSIKTLRSIYKYD